MMLQALQSRDTLSGLLFIASGLVGAVLASNLPIGDKIHMEAGYMPLVLSITLTGLGVLVLARSLFDKGATAVAWQARPLMFVAASALVFGLTIERTGLLLSIFLTVLTAAAALPEWRRLEALALAAGLSLFSALLFVMLLRLPIPVLP
jgi:hypothetical protein